MIDGANHFFSELYYDCIKLSNEITTGHEQEGKFKKLSVGLRIAGVVCVGAAITSIFVAVTSAHPLLWAADALFGSLLSHDFIVAGKNCKALNSAMRPAEKVHHLVNGTLLRPLWEKMFDS